MGMGARPEGFLGEVAALGVRRLLTQWGRNSRGSERQSAGEEGRAELWVVEVGIG